MPLVLNDIKAVIFDWGNTLIEFGPRQVRSYNRVLKETPCRMFSVCDLERLTGIRDRQILAPPYKNNLKENDKGNICVGLIGELYNATPSEEQIQVLLNSKYRAFLGVVKISDNIPALISNSPYDRAIRDSLDKFKEMVVSGEIGYIKPHPSPFETMLTRLNLNARQCIYIGDTWLDDIQGAKRIGMQAIQTALHIPYKQFAPSAGDHKPDVKINYISELKRLLIKRSGANR